MTKFGLKHLFRPSLDNPHDITINDGMLNLTSLWKACGGVKHQKPQKWSALPSGRGMIAALEAKENARLDRLIRDDVIDKGSKINPLLNIKKGRYGGTYAHPLLGLAYAQYLSPEFHIWCNEILIATNLITIEDGDLFTKLGEDGKSKPH